MIWKATKSIAKAVLPKAAHAPAKRMLGKSPKPVVKPSAPKVQAQAKPKAQPAKKPQVKRSVKPTKKVPNYVECAFTKNRTEFIAAFAQTIPQAVRPFEGGSNRRHRVRLNFHTNQMEMVLICLETVLNTWKEDVHFRTDLGRFLTIGELREKFRSEPFSWLDVRLKEAGSDDPKQDLVYFSVIEFEFWSVQGLSYKSAPPMVCARGNEILHPLRETTFAKLTKPAARPTKSKPWQHLSDIAGGRDVADHPFEIDVVYTWVDDQDPDWIASKQEAQSGVVATTETETSSRAFLDERFANRDELMYSLRSLELYAPFVRHIYLVTAGQRPKWLVDKHPRLTVVDHKEIYGHPDCLPVFNSSSIETQLHRVKGLSEHFLYMNDDFFFGRVCEPGDFFQSNGIAQLPYSNTRVSEIDIDETSEEYVIADKNALELFAKEYGFKAAPLLIHSPYPARVSLLKEMEETFPDAFEKCERQKFRSKDDLRPIAFMFPHLAYERGMATSYSIANRYLALWKPSIKEQLNGVLKTRKYKTFCINDVGIPESRKKGIESAVKKFLDNYFPRKSSFEK